MLDTMHKKMALLQIKWVFQMGESSESRME